MTLRIEPATERDLPAIVHLVRQLAQYEKLEHAMVASQGDFRQALFGAERNAHALMAFMDDTAVGFALYFYNFSTFLGKRGSGARVSRSRNRERIIEASGDDCKRTKLWPHGVVRVDVESAVD